MIARDCSDTDSIIAPPFSPITNVSTTENEAVLDDDNVESDRQVQEVPTEVLEPNREEGRNSTIWNGFKLVVDNVDKNYHRCFHQMDKKTTSIHYVHYYAVHDHIDLSNCSEALPTAPIDVQKLIVDTDDLALLSDDAIELMARLFMCTVSKIF